MMTGVTLSALRTSGVFSGATLGAQASMISAGIPGVDPPALHLDLQLIRKEEEPLIHDIDLFLEQADLGKLPAGPVDVLSASGCLEDVAPVVGAAQASVRADDDMFFVVDVAFTWRKFRRWTQLFPRVKPFFAVKCNPNPYLVRVLAACPGCGFDCASIAEMQLVLSNGVSPRRIIFANPCKTPEALDFALNAGVRTMTFDGVEELHKVAREYAAIRDRRQGQRDSGGPLEPPQLILRVRVPDSHSDVPLGEKYGANVEASAELIDCAMSLSLELIGVSFHCGSGCHSSEAYQQAVRMARQVFDLAAERGLTLRVLDIGGGFPGFDGSEPIYHTTPPKPAAQPAGVEAEEVEEEELPLSCEAIATDLLPLLDELFPPDSGVQLMSEPGRYFVEGSHVLFTQVYSRRWVDSKNAPIPSPIDSPSAPPPTQGARVLYFVGEGVLGCFKDALLCNESFKPIVLPLEAITQASAAGRGKEGGSTDGLPPPPPPPPPASAEEEEVALYPSTILGPSGESFDCLVPDLRLPSVRVGDWLYFVRMGAYTASIASASSAVYRPPPSCASSATGGHAPPPPPFAYIATRRAEEGRE